MRPFGMRAAAVALIALAGAAGAQAQSDLAAVPRITLEQFKKDLDADKLIVIDVRAPEGYKYGHIPGSINVPLGLLSTPSRELADLKAAKKPIVAYCAWPSEHSSARAAQLLEQAGVKNVRAMLGGYNAWLGAGYAVVKGDQPR